MIEAKPNRVLDALFFFFMRRALRRRFAGVLARGLEHAAALQPGRAVLVCANHSNWWDGFVARLVGERIQRLTGKNQRYLMQDETHLRRYPFFGACGVFGIDQRRPSAGLRYSAKLLKEPHTQLWMFPQGTLLPVTAPLEIRDGAAFLARLAGTQVLPVAIRYEWLIESKPTILVDIGPPLSGCGCATADIRHAMQLLLEAPRRDLLRHATPGYEALLAPRMSINRVWDYLWHRLGGKPASEFRRTNA